MKLLDLFNEDFDRNDLVRMPYIIAEAGVNHENDINIALRLIREAKEGGADAIKFQTYKAETLASKNSPSYWDTTKEPIKSQFELFKKFDSFSKNEFFHLKEYCDEIDIEFMSTPFDIESATYLNDIMEVFKISSSDITNKPFIEFLCNFGKPIIISTGASNLDEIKQAISWIESRGVKVAILHCILNYPTIDSNANLGMIKDLQVNFPGRIIGYSDHTLPKNLKNLELATILGSAIIEKHFTHDKSLQGNDHYHAMDKSDLIQFQVVLKKMFSILGNQKKYPLLDEQLSRDNARRSLVALTTINKGEVIMLSHLTWKRPASGISPSDIDQVIGKKAIVKIIDDDVIKWDMLS
jgi:sialic acid synthase SpsE